MLTGSIHFLLHQLVLKGLFMMPYELLELTVASRMNGPYEPELMCQTILHLLLMVQAGTPFVHQMLPHSAVQVTVVAWEGGRRCYG